MINCSYEICLKTFVVFEKWTHAHLYQVALKIMLLSILIGNSVTDYLSVVHYSDFKIIKIYLIFLLLFQP